MSVCGSFSSHTQVKYFSRTQEYIFSCCSNTGKVFKMAKFDNDMNIIQNSNLTNQTQQDYTFPSNIYGFNIHNIVLIPEYKQYVFVIDTNKDGNTTTRFYFLPNYFIPSEIVPISLSATIINITYPSTFIENNSSIIDTAKSLIKSTLLKPNNSNTTSNILKCFSTNTSPNIISTLSSKINYLTKSTMLLTSFSNYSISTIPSIYSNLIQKIIYSYSSFSYSPLINNQKVISTVIQKKIKETELCSYEYFFKNSITNECEKYCPYNEFINEICYINNLTENNIMNITENFRYLISRLDTDENTNIIIDGNNVVYQIISSEVMNENINKNISIINFGECEGKLKSVYHIDYILIMQIDIFLSNSTNIILKYEVYNPYTLEKIDLSICNNMTINIYLPYSISNEDLKLYIKLKELGYDLFNPNDSFYHDFCTPFTTDNKTDVLLSDRRLDYYINISFCEEGCTYKSYDYINKKVECECGVKEEIDNNIDNVKFYANLLYSNFFEIESFSNIKVLKCFKLVFSRLGETKNYGSYILILLVIIFIIIMILFYKYGNKYLLKLVSIAIRNKFINIPIKRKNKNKIEKKKRSNYFQNFYESKDEH